MTPDGSSSPLSPATPVRLPALFPELHTPTPPPNNPDHASGYSTDHVIYTSPITGTQAEKRAKRRKKALKKRAATLAQRKTHADKREQERLDQVRTEAEEFLRVTEQKKRDTLANVLAILKTNHLTWGDLVLFVSEPANGLGRERYDGMFAVPGRVDTILDMWVSWKNSQTARNTVHQWALAYISRIVNREANNATKSGILQSRKMSVNEAFALTFSLSSIYDKLREMCPCMTLLMHEFSMTRRQKNQGSSRSTIRNETVSTWLRM